MSFYLMEKGYLGFGEGRIRQGFSFFKSYASWYSLTEKGEDALLGEEIDIDESEIPYIA